MVVPSLKTKMSLVVSLLLTGIVLSMAAVGSAYFGQQLKESISRQQFAMVSALAGEIDDKILNAQLQLVALGRLVTPDIIADPRKAGAFCAGQPDAGTLFDNGLALFSASGRLVAGTGVEPHMIGRNYAFRDYFRKAVQTGRPAISEPFFASQHHAHPIVMFAVPVFDKGGKITAVLGGSLDLMKENFLGKIAGTRLGDRGYLYLYSPSRTMIIHPDRRRILAQDVPVGVNRLFDRAIAGFEGSGETVTSRGMESLSSFKRLGSTGWILAANYPTSEAYAPIHRAKRYLLAGLALAIPASILIVWAFMGYLIAPLLALTGHAREMTGTGEGAPPLQVKRRDEIGILATAYNRMLTALGEQRGALREEKEFSESLIENSAVPTFVIDREHRVIFWNCACEELTGVRAVEMIGTDRHWQPFYGERRPCLSDMVLDGNIEAVQSGYGISMKSPLIPDGIQAEGWFPKLNGRDRYLFFDAAPIRNSQGETIAAIETLQDITERKQAEERYRRLIEHSPDGIALLVDGNFAFINPAGVEILGIDEEYELLGRPMEELVHPDSRALFDQQLRYVLESGNASPWIEERFVHRDGSAFDVEVAGWPFAFRGEPALQVIFRDITDRKDARQRLERLAHFDSLTGLPNRALFHDRLHRALAEAKRYNHPMALFFLDLDRFKEINDSLGHDAGDRVLAEAARRIEHCVRSCDTVARMGGDEFTVILGRIADEGDAAIIARRIVEALAAPFQVGDWTYRLGASIGISVFPLHGTDADCLLKTADSAMYRVKESGRNGYLIHGIPTRAT